MYTALEETKTAGKKSDSSFPLGKKASLAGRKTQPLAVKKAAPSVSQVDHATKQTVQRIVSTLQEGNTFESVTQKLQGCDTLLKRAHLYQRNVQGLCRHLARADWVAIMQEYATRRVDLLAIHALYAFHQGKVTDKQFATLIFSWLLIKSFPLEAIRIVPLFTKSGEVDEFARGMIKASFFNPTSKNSFLTKEQRHAFFEKMREAPKSERVFFLVSNKMFSNLNKACNKPHTLFEKVNRECVLDGIHRAGVFVLNASPYPKAKGFSSRIIPSLSLMQNFLTIYAGLNKVDISLSMGESTAKEIEKEGLQGKRTMYLPFPERKYPKKADEFVLNHPLDFIHHEFYHAIVASEVPHIYREGFTIYAHAVCAVRDRYEKQTHVKQYLNELYERLIDLEHPAFRKQFTAEERRIAPDTTRETQVFLFACLYQGENAFNRIRHRQFKKMFLKNPQVSPLDFERVHRTHRLYTERMLQNYQVTMQIAAKLIDLNFISFLGITEQDLQQVYAYELLKHEESKEKFKKCLMKINVHAEMSQSTRSDIDILHNEMTILENWPKHNLCNELLNDMKFKRLLASVSKASKEI